MNQPITFDRILPSVREALGACGPDLSHLAWLVINRDLLGRIRLIVPENGRDKEAEQAIDRLATLLPETLGAHAYPRDRIVLEESNREAACQSVTCFAIEDFPNVWMADRLANEGDWSSIEAESSGPPRIVFFSIKGGVGRSTALAATAWWLAEQGKRVLVLDLDLESPGLSTALLPLDRQPPYGITDWLVEDLIDNGAAVFDDLVATSGLSHDGEIYVVPSHGAEPGEYVSKLGRVWMPKILADGSREAWSNRLRRLLNALEDRVRPDVVLIDSRAGIDDLASTCVTDLGAKLTLLFAIDGSQTWSGYRILFEHWRRRNVALRIRTRLQIVGALIPELDEVNYLESVTESAYDLFATSLYDEVPPGSPAVELWHFQEADDTGPHYPWAIKWNRGLAALRSLHGKLSRIDVAEVESIFGPLLIGMGGVLNSGSNDG
jgi:hypothetical protein